jgi:hypothetical protein
MSDQYIIDPDVEPDAVTAARLDARFARLAVLEVAARVKAEELDALLADIRTTADEINALAAGRRLAPLMTALATQRLHNAPDDDYTADGDEAAFVQGM